MERMSLRLFLNVRSDNVANCIMKVVGHRSTSSLSLDGLVTTLLFFFGRKLTMLGRCSQTRLLRCLFGGDSFSSSTSTSSHAEDGNANWLQRQNKQTEMCHDEKKKTPFNSSTLRLRNKRYWEKQQRDDEICELFQLRWWELKRSARKAYCFLLWPMSVVLPTSAETMSTETH